MSGEAAIELCGLTKVFGPPEAPRVAVDQLTLDVPRGSVFGFLGRNGAGKTTTIRAIVGQLHPTAGEVRTLGGDPWRLGTELRRRVAYVSESMRLPDGMSAGAAIELCAAQYPAWDFRLAERLMRDFQVPRTAPFQGLSRGERSRVLILLALCQGAELLVLDEPATGLDVEGRRELLSQILEIACEGGRTVFISSHNLGDLERIVDRIAIIRNGRLIVTGELEELKARVRTLQLPPEVPARTLERYFSVLRFEAGEPWGRAIVTDFDPERLDDLRVEQALAEAPRDTGLALEELYLELNQSAPAREKE